MGLALVSGLDFGGGKLALLLHHFESKTIFYFAILDIHKF
jgi:hypothetical protein